MTKIPNDYIYILDSRRYKYQFMVIAFFISRLNVPVNYKIFHILIHHFFNEGNSIKDKKLIYKNKYFEYLIYNKSNYKVNIKDFSISIEFLEEFKWEDRFVIELRKLHYIYSELILMDQEKIDNLYYKVI